ncbi:MAG: C69 family dipeptidase [Bacteroidales bacterium]|jgi:dipeptidase|nr:C69 family dipeptidase [Bacteroidales bacterium]NCU35939.1 dipeptidase [Candidatus Falkowbacteria bacterium]MDD2631270.1 C69 family dipeptidase [Bacteroidales bacterium]MDD3130243.1 C69 family dipeptidase [Bacteroidales bacterium]MDD3525880.1 C69 family dipeptidase [Bacteroidales bacterium]
MKNRILTALLLTFFIVGSGIFRAEACTNYLITKGASVDGSTMISYAADSHVLYGELYHWAAATWPEGTLMDVYEWDTGKYLGKIKQAAQTYNVVGNINEFQVSIGETTYGGLPELGSQEGAIIDYGSLIYITLQRARTAREAIRIYHELMSTYGYASSGESFSIADANEVWILELIGKGNGHKGAVWVARMVPDGYVSAHANHARITTFPRADGKTSVTADNFDLFMKDKNIQTIYSPDVISFAREKGFFKGKDENFSFSDTYAPVDFGGARFCEIRVWSMFNDVTDDMDKYWEYVKGNIEHGKTLANGDENVDKYATNRMPLWVKPNKKISPLDMFEFMRDHLEGTELDMSKDIGAGPFGVPYRWRPLTFEVDGVSYCNERATATQQTGFSFITQMRNWLPDPIGGIIWFGVDDASCSVYMPMYCGITRAPHSIERGNGALMRWSSDAAFWVFNQVSNFAYTRWNAIYPEVKEKIDTYEQEFVTLTPMIDEKAKALYDENPNLAIAYLTDYSTSVSDRVTNEWQDFYRHLFMKFMDGNIKTPNPGQQNPNVSQPGYGDDFYRKIVTETGDKLKVIDSAH